MLPKEYLKSLTPGVESDFIYKYDGGQINLRSYLTVDECEALPMKFYEAPNVAQRCILFGLLARYPNRIQMFPRDFANNDEEQSKRVDEEFGGLNGLAINQIVTKVGLLEDIFLKFKTFNYLEGEEGEDGETEEGE